MKHSFHLYKENKFLRKKKNFFREKHSHLIKKEMLLSDTDLLGRGALPRQPQFEAATNNDKGGNLISASCASLSLCAIPSFCMIAAKI